MTNYNSSISSLESKPNLTEQIRILIADDQHFAHIFLEKILSSDRESNLQVIGTASNGQQAVQQVEFLQPDVVIMDLEMPKIDGITATKMIVQKFPDCKILVFSSHDDANHLHNALQAGATGYLLKNTPSEELRKSIRLVNKGYYQVSPGLLVKAFAEQEENDDPALVEIESSSSSPTDTQLPSSPGWSNSTQELLNTFPRVWSRGLVYMLVTFMTIALPWTILARIDETGTARGKIEPKEKTLSIDAAVAGKVTEVRVKEGQQVKAGQELLAIESAAVTSQLQQQQEKLAGLKNQLVQLQSLKERHLQGISSQKRQNQAQIVEQQVKLQKAQQSIASLQALSNPQKQEKRASLEQAQKAIKTNQAVYELAQIRLRSAKEKVPRYRQVYQDGAISQDRLLEITQIANEAQQELARANGELDTAKSSLKEAQNSYQALLKQQASGIKQAKLHLSEEQGIYNSLLQTNNLALLQNQEKLKDTEAKIATLNGEIAQTVSQIKSSQFELKQYVIKAPVAGTIFQFPIQNAGTTVQAGDTVAAIAKGIKQDSSKSNLVLRAKMPSSEMAFLKIGLPAKIKFDAYPFQDYGIVEGRVSWISPDSKIADQQQSTQQQAEFFELEITLDQASINSAGKPIPIAPGQTASAEIVIRQRRLIDFFLEPFQKLRKGGLEL
jgi:hemolysin D